MNREPIFNSVRMMLNRSFNPAEIVQLDEACDLAEAALRANSSARNIATDEKDRGREVSDVGIALIHSFEGCGKMHSDGRYKAYPDPGSGDGKPWTIGWGSTGPDIEKGVIWTKEQCDERFKRDLQKYANAVAAVIADAATSQNQFDALVSFHYNTGAIRTATLTKRHCAGRFKAAEAEFGRWTKNNGKVMKGLVRRRKAEAELYASQ